MDDMEIKKYQEWLQTLSDDEFDAERRKVMDGLSEFNAKGMLTTNEWDRRY